MGNIDPTALFNIGYGLYVVTTNDGEKDNGAIVNTVCQITNSPNRVVVGVNKQNYTYEAIKKTGIMNINCITEEAPFSLFQHYGFQSGRDVDKFFESEPPRTENGLIYITRYVNSVFSLKVEQYIDVDTHGLFICTLEETIKLSSIPTMTYTYYQNNVKPKKKPVEKKGYVCKVCGWVYEGEELPEDIICPVCKHGAADFEKIK
jgi:flavin reductase (DIM6/NTAB) family NADH-FMN oxidoreductase RutF